MSRVTLPKEGKERRHQLDELVILTLKNGKSRFWEIVSSVALCTGEAELTISAGATRARHKIVKLEREIDRSLQRLKKTKRARFSSTGWGAL